ncbi:unnamed protein product, partial [Ectocarpus sp. 8 AP-2014]
APRYSKPARRTASLFTSLPTSRPPPWAWISSTARAHASSLRLVSPRQTELPTNAVSMATRPQIFSTFIASSHKRFPGGSSAAPRRTSIASAVSSSSTNTLSVSP